MQRNSFLKTCTALFVMAGSSFQAFARKFRTSGAILVRAGEARNDQPMTLFEGDTFHTKVATADSDGDVFVFESTRLKEGGPSYHLHYEQDEYWYILKGIYRQRR